MGTTSGPADLNIAHQGSGHVAPGPPTPSGGPAPTPSGQWIPAPYMYISRSQTLHKSTGSGSRTEFGGNRACVQDSYMDVDQPANLPAKPGEKQPTGADLSNQAIIGVAQIASATGRAYSKAKKFAITMDPVKLCVPGENMGSVHLSNGVLLDAGAPGMSFAEMNKHAAVVTQSGDPVDVVRGVVLDERTDFFLPGKLYLVFKRLYDSGRARESSPFGKGGFTHNFDLRVTADPAEERTVVRLDDGRDFVFPLLARGAESFSRKKRLTLRRKGDEYALYSHDTRLTHHFEPLAPGEPAALRSIMDAWGNALRLDYEEGRLTRIVDSALRELRFTHDGRGRITRAEVVAPTAFRERVPDDYRPMGHVVYGYDDDSALAFAEDALGGRESYRYDGRRRLVEKTLKNGTTFRYDYDDLTDRCVRSAADGGLRAVELHHDAKKKTTLVHGTPEPREHTYDDGGLVVRTRTPDGAVDEIITVDEDQLVVNRKNAAGEETLYEHDEHGNPTKVVRPDGSEIVWTWADDLLISRTDPGERVSTCAYDGFGGLVRWTQPSGRWHSYDLDRWGRIKAVYDVAGLVTSFEYDEQHNVVRERDARGTVTDYAYDPLGRMTSKKDALGRVRSFAYDLLGRLTREAMPDGTVLQYTWDAMGNVVETHDGWNADRAEYAGTGTLVQRRLPDGSGWQYRHDVEERLREIANDRGERHRLGYDRAGRVTEEELFDGQSVRYRYGKNNLVSRVDHADRTFSEREYDGMGQLVRDVRPDGAVSYERNEVGWIVKATTEEHFGEIVTEITYDADGRVLSRSVDGKTIRYTYDEAGLLTARTLPNGQTTRYFNDAAGYVTAIEHEGEKVALQRDPLGREIRRHLYAAGVDLYFRYDHDDRLAGLAVMAPAHGPKPLIERSWTRGRHGRLATVEDGSAPATTYTHDARGRLLGYRQGVIGCQYGYDAAGYLDRIERSEGGPRGEQGRLALAPGNVVLACGEARFENDARRRRRRRVRGGEVTEYFWDSRSRLREVHLPSGEQVHLAYDAFGHLSRKLIVSPMLPEQPELPRKMRWVDYLWDGDELCLVTTSEGRERVFVTEPRSFFPLFQREDEQTLYYVTSPLGVPTERLDARGTIVDRFAFGPFGEEPSGPARDPLDMPFRLLGQVFHPEIGLSSTLHRWFDASTARWLTPDPIGLFGGSDLHGFDGSPTERVDALGLYTAAAFQQFLNDTHQPRIDANNAALAAQRGGNPNGPNCLGPATASASTPIRPGQPGPATSQNSGNGAAGHAERDPLRDAQGLPPSPGSSGVGAIGAGRPHCGGCTGAIVNTPGAVPASSIRGATTDRDGNPTGNGGYEIPPASGPPGFLP